MKGPDRESLSLWKFLKIGNQFLQRLQGTLLQNWILQIVCLENKFVDDSKAVLKKIISEYISSSNYNVDDDDDITFEEDECLGSLMKSATVIVGSRDSDLWCLIFTETRKIRLNTYFLGSLFLRKYYIG